MKNRLFRHLVSLPRIALALLLALIGASGRAAEAPLRLQLKWHHQFQFAGYYAAQLKGFYAEAGLEVQTIEGNAQRDAINSVLAGAADFGVGDADLLLHRLRGHPLVVCAAIFQHSPYVIMSVSDKGIRSPHDLVGMRVMMAEGQGATQFQAMLAREGVDPVAITIVPHSWNLDDLIAGRVDAVSAYATAEPWQMRRRGVAPALLRTLDYGVDFYGDALFTTEEFLKTDKTRALAFVEASLRGWEYAMRHPEELVDHILTLPGVKERGTGRDELLAEAEAMQAYVLPEVVEIGHMNPGRWRAIADIFAEQGLIERDASLEGFVLADEPGQLRRLVRWIAALAATLGAGTALVLFWNMQMRARVHLRTRELQSEIARRESAEAELSRGRERLKLAQSVGGIGDWTYEKARDRITWSDTLFVLHARDVARKAPGFEEWMSLYHPDDALRLRAAFDRASELGEDFELDVRLRLPDGRQMFHHLVGKRDAMRPGAPMRMHGIEQDVTARKIAEERLRGQLRELERWRQATLGREERVHDLKREINAVLRQFGQPPRYAEESPSSACEADARHPASPAP